MLKKPNNNQITSHFITYTKMGYRWGHNFFRRPTGLSVLLHFALLVIILLCQQGVFSSNPKVNSLTLANTNIINATVISQSSLTPQTKKRTLIKKKPKPKPKLKPKLKPKPNTYSLNTNRKRQRPKPKKTQTNIQDKLRELAQQSFKQSLVEENAHQNQRVLSAKIRNSQAVRYMLLLQGLVRENWVNPFSRDAKLSVTLKVKANNQGDVLGVSVVSSSGNSIFDRQAILAVKRTSPLPVPKETQLLKRSRIVNLTFNNQDSIGV